MNSIDELAFLERIQTQVAMRLSKAYLDDGCSWEDFIRCNNTVKSILRALADEIREKADAGEGYRGRDNDDQVARIDAHARRHL